MFLIIVYGLESLFFFLLEPRPVHRIAFARFDLAGFDQCDPGELWTDELVDQHAEEDDVPDHAAHFLAERLRGHHHAERDAGLREQRDAEVFPDGLATAHGGAARVSSEVFAQAADKDVHDSDHNVHGVAEYAELESSAREHEERRVQRRRPSERPLHYVDRVFAEIAEDRPEHHADEER